MHGRVKVRTTQEQEEARQKKRQERLQQYQLAMGAIQKMRSNGVKDEESLKISEQLLSNNPDISTLWNYRREILIFLRESESQEKTQARAEYELKLTETCLRANPKSYGAWHHRCWVLENAPKPNWEIEVALCDKYLELDERNFHCWDYRRFVILHALVTRKDEIDFTTRKIQDNFSNYSSWHYRSRLLSYSDSLASSTQLPVKRPPRSEFDLVKDAVFTDPGDQSAWIYLRWLLGKVEVPLSIERAALKESGTLAFSREVSLTVDATDSEADYCLQILYRSSDDKLENIPVKCEPVWKCKYSNLWTFKFDDPASSKRDDTYYVKVTNKETDEEVQPIISLNPKAGLNNFSSKAPQFSVLLNEDSRDVLINVYESCKDLIEIEADSKWARLTSLLTMHVLNKHEMLSNILSEIEQLCLLDPKRFNYYNDVRSRILMECALERQPENPVKINLSNNNLTALYHSEYLCLMKEVDLSKNKLGRSLTSLLALQSCEILILDENQLQNVKGFPNMPALRFLSLKNNCLTDVEELKNMVVCCKSLQTIDANGNPCMPDSTDGKINFI